MTSVNYERALIGFYSVCETHSTASKESDPGGLRVRNLTSSFDNTASGSKGIIPAPLKLAWAFCLVIDLKKAFLKAIKNLVFVMWLTRAFIYSLISRLYACFNGLKQAISRGCVK